MILLADLENQLFSIALYSEEGRKEHAFSTFADPLKSKEELFEFLKSYLMMLSVDVSKIQGSLLSSVVPSMTKKVQGAIELLTGMKCPVLNKSVKTGVAIRMDNPGEVGSDLLALACGAYEKYQTDTLVINVGSVVSFTIVSSKKEFVGGALFPRVRTFLQRDVVKLCSADGYRVGDSDKTHRKEHQRIDEFWNCRRICISDRNFFKKDGRGVSKTASQSDLRKRCDVCETIALC